MELHICKYSQVVKILMPQRLYSGPNTPLGDCTDHDPMGVSQYVARKSTVDLILPPLCFLL